MLVIHARSARLEAMEFGYLLKIYFKETAIKLYLILAFICALITYLLPPDATLWVSVATVFITYPFVEYMLHRFVLHSQLLYRHKMTSTIWKRIHYDHHRDPGDNEVTLGAIYTMLPAAVIVTVPIGLAIGGLSSMFAALTTGFILIAFYELVHCSQHLLVNPKNRYLKLIKRMHMLHHHHNEKGNFGITSPICDYIFGTYYSGPSECPKSSTVNNLGYDQQTARKFPWVAQFSNARASDLH